MKRIRHLALAAALIIPVAAGAAPTVNTIAGETTVALDPGFVAAVTSLGVDVGREFPARLSRGQASFPIPAGEIDLGTARGEIAHAGGLNLSVPGLTVTLGSFVIDTTGDSPRLTGLVKANDSIVARLPLFDLTLTRAPFARGAGQLLVDGVDVTLTSEAAAALNDVFGLDGVFAEGFPIGTASVRAVLHEPDRVH